MKVTLPLFLLFTAFKLSFLQKFNDTLLSCYICMDLEYALKQPCDENRAMFQTCAFTKDLINWDHVMDKLDFEVTFKCLLLIYTDNSDEIQIFRGCVANHDNYDVCTHLVDFVKYKEQISCELCNISKCNLGIIPLPNFAHNQCSNLYLILLFIILYPTIT